jgi:hypothetical protein
MLGSLARVPHSRPVYKGPDGNRGYETHSQNDGEAHEASGGDTLGANEFHPLPSNRSRQELSWCKRTRRGNSEEESGDRESEWKHNGHVNESILFSFGPFLPCKHIDGHTQAYTDRPKQATRSC